MYKSIPQMAKILSDERVRHFLSRFYLPEIKEEVESVLDKLRSEIKDGKVDNLNYDDVIERIVNSLYGKSIYSLRKVVNGTGTILHTNLGRALLSRRAIENVVDVMSGYSNLEYNIESGKRGSRYDHVCKKIANMCGAEDAIVVNNNAAATMLAVTTFAKDKEVIVSRGELVEIGGSFRIPDIIEATGARLKEVGTTNRTHLRDYKRATNKNTGMYLKVHPSNYSMKGFTKEVSNVEIAELGKKNQIITCEDLGSGALVDLTEYTGIKENTVQESIKSGVDLVTFSGDKLLGGPQAGVIVGKKDLINIIKENPLARAFRIGKLTISALEATIRDYFDMSLPIYHLMKDDVKDKAKRLEESISKLDIKCEVIECFSTVGGGSLPDSKIKSYGILFDLSFEEFFRKGKIPVIGLIKDDKFYIDVRTLLKGDEEIIIERLREYE